MARVIGASGRAAVADVALQLAVLLQAGVTPERSWRYAAAAGVDDAVARDDLAKVVARLDSGTPVARALSDAGPVWAPLAASWRVATEVGAPLGPTLRGFAEALRDAVDATDDVAVALAEPAGTARLMAWLPLGGVLLGFALGLDPVAGIAQPLGAASVAAGLALTITARLWTNRLVRSAQPPDALPGEQAELCATALSGGVSIDRALALVRETRPRDEIETEAVPISLERILRLSREAGVPAVELLRAEAMRERRRARIDGRLAAARLARRLLIPLGVCTLPAFLLLGVAPLIFAVLTSASPWSAPA